MNEDESGNKVQCKGREEIEKQKKSVQCRRTIRNRERKSRMDGWQEDGCEPRQMDGDRSVVYTAGVLTRKSRRREAV